MIMNVSKYNFIDDELQQRRQSGQLRTLRHVKPAGPALVEVDGESPGQFLFQ